MEIRNCWDICRTGVSC